VASWLLVGPTGPLDAHHSSRRPSIPTQTFDVRSVLARILDGSRLDEFKAQYGTTLVSDAGHTRRCW
jgi:acetyl-CoA carboxylase carboxyltransferase component